jgi:hypothetical protein
MARTISRFNRESPSNYIASSPSTMTMKLTYPAQISTPTIKQFPRWPSCVFLKNPEHSRTQLLLEPRHMFQSLKAFQTIKTSDNLLTLLSRFQLLRKNVYMFWPPEAGQPNAFYIQSTQSPKMSQQLEREAIRDQLSLCRAQQDLVEEDDLEQVERGEREMMVSFWLRNHRKSLIYWSITIWMSWNVY